MFTPNRILGNIYSSNAYIGIGTTFPQTSLHVIGDIITNGNVGIGTTLPRKALDIEGDVNLTGSLYQNNSLYVTSQWTTSGTNLYVTGSNVGIGTTLPQAPLHVEGVIQCSTGDADKIQFTEYANASKIAHIAGWGVGIYAGIDNANTGVISFNNATTSGFVERMRIDTNGNLGIGTSLPEASLHVIGDIITTTNIGIGTVTPKQALDVIGTAIISDNVGIGTTLPQAPLHIIGDTIIENNYWRDLQTIALATGTTPNNNVLINGTNYNLGKIGSGGGTSYHSAVITENNQVFIWGGNWAGQLGNNTTNNSIVPINISSSGALAGKKIVAISTGYSHTIALDNTGTLYAWGANWDGQLGNNTTTDSLIPIDISSFGSLAGKTIIRMGAGAFFSFAIDNTGKVHTWGRNTEGELGNNSTIGSLVPIDISSYGSLSGKTIVSVSFDWYHAIALDSTGKVHIWGDNSSGQLGNNTTINSIIPIDISSFGSLAGKTIVAVTVGASHSMALDSDGKVHIWGANGYGQLGNNSTTDSLTPINISSYGSLSGKTIVAIATGDNHSIALDTEGKIHIWGWNGYGQLGNNSITDILSPIDVSSFGSLVGKKITEIYAGDYYSVALDNTGKIHSWGYNGNGELGNNTTTNSLVPIEISLNEQIFVNGQTVVLGNVGIGTSIPRKKLDVIGDIITSTNIGIGTTLPRKELDVIGDSIITGNLGIGTTLPKKALDVMGDIMITGDILPSACNVYNLGSSNYRFKDLYLSGNSIDIEGVIIHKDNYTEGLQINNAIGSNLLSIDGDGNIGIGTTLPQKPLHVIGDTLIDNSYITQITTLATGTTTNNNISINGTVYNLGTIGSGGGISYHTAVIMKNNQVYIWGKNDYGQLGNNTTTNSLTPINISSFGALFRKTIVCISIGYAHTIALDDTGKVYTWGHNNTGQLGNNNAGNNSYIPIDISSFGSLAGKTIVRIGSGYEYSAAIDNTGKVYTWGYNNQGQLGNNTTTNSSVPIDISSYGSLVGKTIVAISCGGFHTIALDNMGGVHTWGNNYYGKLGNNTYTRSLIPINISSFGSLAGKKIIAVTCGDDHAIALDSIGNIHTWGHNNSGQLGNNTTTDSPIPIDIASYGSLTEKHIIAIAAGSRHSMALSSDGKIHTWGWNWAGQLGNNTIIDNYIPIDISSFGSLAGKVITEIYAGDSHSVALDNTGKIHTWGYNVDGELGNNTTTNSAIPEYISTSSTNTLNIFGDIFTSGTMSIDTIGIGISLPKKPLHVIGEMLIDNSGLIQTNSTLATGTTTNNNILINATNYNLKIIGSGGGTAEHTGLITSDNQVYMWGNNDSGELGNNTTTNSLTPINISSYGSLVGKTIVAISCGGYHTIALDNMGGVHTWGRNQDGQLGNNSTTDSLIPIDISSFGSLSGKTIVRIGTGNYFSIAIDSTGSVHTWGRNDYGQLGNNTTTNSLIPIDISSFGSLVGKIIVAVSCGVHHTIALDSDGKVHTWGNNVTGQLGNNTTTNSSIPIDISSFGSLAGKKIIAVTCGGDYAIALDIRGIVHTWGDNSYGQLGNNTTIDSPIPIDISSYGSLTQKHIIAIAAGNRHNIVIDNLGNIYTWGNNSYGQLGNNSTTDSLIPIRISSYGSLSGKIITEIYAGNNHSVALDSSGKVHTWGGNSNGQLGNNTTSNSLVSIEIVIDLSLVRGQTIISVNVGIGTITPRKALDIIGDAIISGNIGIGITNPSYQLQLSTDSAAKPTTTTWTVSSDRRIKEDIQNADLNRCYDVVKDLRLCRFKWNSNYMPQVSDQHMLGWIAQEVEPLIPNAISRTSNYGFPDLLGLDSDQIIKFMYGAIQKNIKTIEDQQIEINKLKEFIATKFDDYSV